MSAQDQVRAASRRFYDALNQMAKGDAGALAGVWSQTDDVTAMHPIGGREVGWDAVRESFEGVAQVSSAGKVELKDQFIRVVGDLAYELGVEAGRLTMAGEQVDFEHRVTNIYERGGGEWKLVHHHTDTTRAMIDVLERLRSEAA